MEIVYKDLINNVITEQQAMLEEDSLKFFYVSGIVKKKECYEKAILTEIFYYREPSESILDVLNMFSDYDVFITIVEPIVIYGNRQKEYCTTYKNGIYVENYKVLMDQYDNKICYVELEEIGQNEPTSYKNCEKAYYGEGAEAAKGDTIFNAYYNEDGSLDKIDVNIPGLGHKDYHSFYPTELTLLQSQLPGNPDLSYYLNAILEPI